MRWRSPSKPPPHSWHAYLSWSAPWLSRAQTDEHLNRGKRHSVWHTPRAPPPQTRRHAPPPCCTHALAEDWKHTCARRPQGLLGTRQPTTMSTPNTQAHVARSYVRRPRCTRPYSTKAMAAARRPNLTRVTHSLATIKTALDESRGAMAARIRAMHARAHTHNHTNNTHATHTFCATRELKPRQSADDVSSDFPCGHTNIKLPTINAGNAELKPGAAARHMQL